MTQTTTVEQMQAELQEVNVNGALVIEKLKALVHTSNSHRILEKYEGQPIVEIPITLGVIGALLAPHVAAIEVIKFLEQHKGLDKVADPLQNWLLRFFSQPGQRRRLGHKIKKVLSGTWNGYTLHPVLSDVPISAWTGTMLLDLLWLVKKEERASRGADLMLTLGLLAATGTMATGVADWSDLNGVARRVGLLHGVFSGTVMFTNLISWVLRLTGKRHAGVAFSTAGYLASLFSAHLAGELIFILSHKSSVNESGEVPRAS